MPCHVNGVFLSDIGEFLFVKCSGDRLFLFFSERTVLNISDKSILRTDFLPVLLTLYDRNLILLLDLGQNRALHSALIANLGILLHRSDGLLAPITDDHNAIRFVV